MILLRVYRQVGAGVYRTPYSLAILKSNGIVIGFTGQEKTRVRENYNYIVLLKYIYEKRLQSFFGGA